MREKVSKIFRVGRRFKKEFRRQIRMLIVVTLGFTIAFTWRQTTFDVSQSIVNFFITVESSSMSSVLTSMFITLSSLLLILLTSKLFKEENGMDYGY